MQALPTNGGTPPPFITRQRSVNYQLADMITEVQISRAKLQSYKMEILAARMVQTNQELESSRAFFALKVNAANEKAHLAGLLDAFASLLLEAADEVRQEHYTVLNEPIEPHIPAIVENAA